MEGRWPREASSSWIPPTAPRPRPPLPPSADRGSPTPTLLRARTPADIAAFVPLALGFLPEHSVVMVSTGAPGGMQARVDLPHDPDDVDDVVEALLRPARRHGVREVVVVVYDDDTTVADEAAWAIHEEFTAAGIEVREVLRVHDDHWYAVLPGAPLAAYRGVPFELAEHPFTAQAVFDGRVTHASREALRATIAVDPVLAGEVEDEIRSARCRCAPVRLGTLVRRHLAAGTRFTRSRAGGRRADRHGRLAPRRGVGVARAHRRARRRRAVVRRRTSSAGEPRRRPGRRAGLRGLARGGRCAGVVRGRPLPRGRARALAWPDWSPSCSSPPRRPTTGRRCDRGSAGPRIRPPDRPAWTSLRDGSRGVSTTLGFGHG